MKTQKKDFSIIAKNLCNFLGSPWSMLIAIVIIIGWLCFGPMMKFSDTWQLIINTATTIITFLMVFVIQNTQNRDTEILNLKLDELIKSIKAADNVILDLESLSEKELNHMKKEYIKIKNKSSH